MAALLQRTIDTIARNQTALLGSWKSDLQEMGGFHNVKPEELTQQTAEFIHLLISGTADGSADIAGPAWDAMRSYLSASSRSRALLGFDSQQTAGFIFAAKRPLMSLLQSEYANEPAVFAEQLWAVSELLDHLALHTVRTSQQSREDVIKRQQEELLELDPGGQAVGWRSRPANDRHPDSQRTQVVMESLLQRIVDTGSEIAIIDITGVPTVDTLVAQHLLKTVTAIRLMGADCIISGVRPQIAQTIVHLGLDLRASSPRPAWPMPSRSPCAVPASPSPGPPDGSNSILRMGEFLLVTIQVDMHDQLALTLQDDLAERISETSARAVLMDISALDMVDSFIGRMIANISGLARIMDAETVVVGMQPAVAITLVELGLELPGVSTALNVERGMQLRERGRAIDRAAAAASRCASSRMSSWRGRPYVTDPDCAMRLIDQTKLVTAVSELARNTVVYGGGGDMDWQIVEEGTRRRAADLPVTKARAFPTSSWP